MEMKTVTFTITIDEANLIFKSLGKMPFDQVYTLIGKLNEQANQQLAGNNSATPFNTIDKAENNGAGH
jgi:hypothetical protein